MRTDHQKYLENILSSAHGSVLEHVELQLRAAQRQPCATHELVRHRPGTAISQESLRFVRLADIPFWFPDWARADAELMKRSTALLEQMEEFQRWMAGHFGLDEEGVPFQREEAQDLVHAPVRARRGGDRAAVDRQHPDPAAHHRGAHRPGAEEEIRLVFGKIGELMRAEAPALFGDYTVDDGAWIPRWRKV